MSNVTFPIHHTFGPLATPEQCRLARRLQFQFGRFKNGGEREELRKRLSLSFGMSASLFSNGREGLLALFRAIELKPGEEVIVQGYTCVVVPNAIHAAGGTAVYADIDAQTLNIDPKKIQRHITPRTRAIICQHTFGIPADTEKLRAICDKRNLLLIEDCAHVLPDSGASAQMSFMESARADSSIGSRGDVLLFSFGRDKSISGVSGGALLTRHREIAQRLSAFEDSASHLSFWKILNLINYPLRYQCAKWLWRFRVAGPYLAKFYLRLMQLFRLLPAVLQSSEREGKASLLVHKLPNACAIFSLQQLDSLSVFNEHRRELTKLYNDAAKKSGWNIVGGILHSVAPQKFPLFVKDADRIRDTLKREQVYLDDGWCGAVVNPRSVGQVSAGYAKGSCPVAEDVSRHVVTLPTHPTLDREQAAYLIHAFRSYLR